jgi:glutathione synthase/RimK-type ligase-like ATP-grasp enzyme
MDGSRVSVLLWGQSTDPVVIAVARASAALGVETLAADGDELASVDIEGKLVTRDDDAHLDLLEVTGVLVRPNAGITLQASAAAYRALHAWVELTPATVLNRPRAAASNRSKPYQLGLIAAAGFAVPDTVITSNAEDVRHFRNQHGAVVYKSTSGVRSVVALLEPGDQGRLEDVSNCPTQFQQFIPGVDHRVHVVGDRVFACRVESTAVDYRYAATAGDVLVMTPVVLRDDLEAMCRTVTKSLSLGLAGIDLRLDPAGQWWCFEVNTAPGFTWFEEHTGLPIAATVAELLT